MRPAGSTCPSASFGPSHAAAGDPPPAATENAAPTHQTDPNTHVRSHAGAAGRECGSSPASASPPAPCDDAAAPADREPPAAPATPPTIAAAGPTTQPAGPRRSDCSWPDPAPYATQPPSRCWPDAAAAPQPSAHHTSSPSRSWLPGSPVHLTATAAASAATPRDPCDPADDATAPARWHPWLSPQRTCHGRQHRTAIPWNLFP